MLKMMKPIQLKIRPLAKLHSFGLPETLRFNYGIISDGIEPEDLLHLVTAPPEVFVAEGGGSGFLSQNITNSSQQNKIEIINNLVNRILLTENENYSYQDRTYISSVLRQLGIHNDERFMNIVHQLKNQTDNTEQLISLYQQNSMSLRQIIQNYEENEQREGKEIPADGEIRPAERYYLQDEIYRRLDTKAVYDFISSYAAYNAGDSSLVRNEAVILGDQMRISQILQLQELKNTVVNEQRSLYYLHANPYESGQDINMTDVTEQTVTEELVSAVLLDLADNIYSAVNENLKRNESTYIDATKVFFRAADNTFSRFESFHSENSVTQESSEEYIRQSNMNQKSEISVLNEFMEKTMPLYFSRHDTETSETEIYSSTQNLINSSRNTVNNQNMQNSVNNTAGNESSTENLTQMTFRQDMHFDTIEEQVAYYEEQNRIIHEKLLNIEKEAPKIPAVKVDRARARRDAAMALEHPEELIKEYTKERSETHSEKQTESRYEALLSKETREIFERYARVKDSPELARQNGMITEGAEKLLIEETREIERTVLQHAIQENPEEPEDKAEPSGIAINNITGKIIENINSRPVGISYAGTEKVNMTHKAVSPEIDEEMVKELIRRVRTERTVSEETSENAREVHHTETVVNNTTREIRNERHEDITELVAQGVKKEMASISNEVMKRIEQRMQLERSRRGY